MRHMFEKKYFVDGEILIISTVLAAGAVGLDGLIGDLHLFNFFKTLFNLVTYKEFVQKTQLYPIGN